MGALGPVRGYPGRGAIRWSILLATLGTAFVACGGEDEGRPGDPTAPAPIAVRDACDDAARYEFLSIVDFEGPPAVGMAPAGGQAPRGTALSCNPALGPGPDSGEGGAGGQPGAVVPVCGFNFNHDGTASECFLDLVSSRKPAVNLAVSGPWVGMEIPGGRCGSPSHAYHLVARNLGVCFSTTTGRRGWGSNFSIDLDGTANPDGAEFDASAWDGIAFWARLGDGPTNRAISVIVGDAETSGADYVEPTPTGQTSCLTTDSRYDSLKCDPFGAAVTIKREWTLYTIAFADLKQKGYGQRAPRGTIDPSRIRRFQISTSTGDWDFYVDDLAFFRSKP